MRYQLLILAAPDLDFEMNYLGVGAFIQRIREQIKIFPNPERCVIAVRPNSLLDIESLEKFDNTRVAVINRLTNGALSTTALCMDNFNLDTPIVITPFDGYIGIDQLQIINEFITGDYDAGLIAFNSTSPLYSYVRMFNQEVIEIAEKRVISGLATTGTFIFKNGKTLLDCIEWSMVNSIKTNEKYFIAPSLNMMVMNQKRIKVFEINESDYVRFDISSLKH
jgi:hypothetical protein